MLSPRKLTSNKRKDVEVEVELQPQVVKVDGELDDGTSSDKETLLIRKKKRCQGNAEAGTSKGVQSNEIDRIWVRSDFEHDEDRVKVKRKNATKDFQSIKFRGGLSVFVKAMANLTIKQRIAVQDIGFGSLLDIQDISIPKLICHYLMEMYSPMKAKITFPDGQEIKVHEEDVQVCLGIPRGGTEIHKVDSHTKTEVLEAWRAHIGRDLHSIRYSDVAACMLNDKSGGSSFIRDFLVLFHSCIVEPLQSGAVNQTLVRNLESVSDVSTWNWCGFVINCLVDGKKKWDGNKTAPFTGPLLFITILYLDRVVLYNKRAVPRSIPAFQGWTKDLVALREHEETEYGTIGEGVVVSRTMATKTSSPKITKQSLSDDMLNMARSIKKFAEHAQRLDANELHDEINRAILESGKSFLCIGFPSQQPDLHINNLGVLQSQSEDPFWKEPNVLKVIEAVEQAFYAREKLNHEKEQQVHNNEAYGEDQHDGMETNAFGGNHESVFQTPIPAEVPLPEDNIMASETHMHKEYALSTGKKVRSTIATSPSMSMGQQHTSIATAPGSTILPSTQSESVRDLTVDENTSNVPHTSLEDKTLMSLNLVVYNAVKDHAQPSVSDATTSKDLKGKGKGKSIVKPPKAQKMSQEPVRKSNRIRMR